MDGIVRYKIRMKEVFSLIIVIIVMINCNKKNNPIIKYTYYKSGRIETKKVYYIPGDTATYTEYVYLPTGELRAIIPYKNSKRNGLRTLYYKNGKIEKTAYFKDDKFWGVVTEYNDNGSLHKRILVINDNEICFSEYIYHHKLNLIKELRWVPSKKNNKIVNYLISRVVFDSAGTVVDSMSAGLYYINNRHIKGSYYVIQTEKDTLERDEKYCFTVKIINPHQLAGEFTMYLGA